jgi:hypothetical protein
MSVSVNCRKGQDGGACQGTDVAMWQDIGWRYYLWHAIMPDAREMDRLSPQHSGVNHPWRGWVRRQPM